MKSLTHCLYLVFLFTLTSCMVYPRYYKKDGVMHLKYYNIKDGFIDREIKDADPETFKSIGGFYSKDAKNVFYSNKKLHTQILLLLRD